MPAFLPAYVTPVALLVISNVFMTFAWYGHLRYKSSPLMLAIVASWGIAFIEYCFVIPANRWGTAEDVGKVVAALVSGDMAYATGSVVHVDGALAIPRL